MFVTWLSATLALACPVLGLTPEQLITAPRRGEAIPDPSGKVAVFSVSQYSFETHESKSEWDLLDLETGEVTTLTDDPNVSEIVWLGPKDTSILYLNASNSEVPGGVELWFSDIENFAGGYKAASIPGPLSGLKAVKTGEGDINFVAYGQSTADGKLYNPETAKKQYSSARIYDSIYPRHWDHYLTPERQAVFSGSLTKSLEKNEEVSYAYSSGLKNLVAPIEYAVSPVPPFGGAGDYDLSPDGKTVAFLSKAPELPKANYTTSYIFTVPHDGSSKPVAINGPDSPNTPKGIRGASASPVFSPDSKQLAYFQMAAPTYESDRRVTYIASLDSGNIRSVAGDWDRSPDTAKWAPNGKELYVTSSDEARGRLFSIPVDAEADYKPESFTKDGYVSAYYPIKESDSLLVTATAIWTNAWYFTASPKNEPRTIFSANENDPELTGLGPDDLDEFYFEGNWTKLQSFIVKPKGFSKDKKYPLAFLIHGGPQGEWGDSWSTRWNPKVWADQGYVVILPNPTGSTGFGQRLTDAIQNDWGGAPYDDLVKAWEYARDKIDYIDTDNGIAAGASYGGFMINWVQGHDLGREFKALVLHDGVFIGENIIATDELWFIQREYNGTFWDNRENYLRFDPAAAENIKRFATPQLIVHSDLDYRLPVTDGIALFNVLQELGVPSRFLNFPDEGHWVLNQENSLVWHQQVLGWINKYSGIADSNEDAVRLSDTVVPVVDIDAGPN